MTSQSFKDAVLNRRMLICVFTGFTSGLPLYVLIQLVPAWLRTEGVGLAEIGFFALVQFPYTWKFLWSPLMDRFTLPFLGRRRGWMLVTQLALFASIAAMGFTKPGLSIWTVAYLSAALAFFSASQDIVLDAYRRELLPDVELGLGNAIHVQTYRLSGLVPGSLALILADHLPWHSVFVIVAAFMGVGMALTLFIDEPEARPDADEEEKRLPDYFISADDIGPTQHVDIQAAAQRWVDSSISKTANVPTDYPYEDFKDIYMYAHEKGLKGCTTFRFNPEAFQGVLVKEKDLESTTYRFVLEDGEVVEVAGNEEIEYDGETHTAANLFDALKEGYYGKF